MGALLSLLLVACEKPGDGLPAGKATPTFKAQVATIDLTDDLWDGHAISYGGFRAGQRPGGVYPSDAEILEDLRILEKNWNLIRVDNSDEHGDAVLRMIAENDIDFIVVHGYGILDGAGIADGLTFLSDHIAAGQAGHRRGNRLGHLR